MQYDNAFSTELSTLEGAYTQIPLINAVSYLVHGIGSLYEGEASVLCICCY